MVVLLVTANSVAKEWVLDEIAAARNLRVPIIPAFLEDVRLPDELQFMLQRTEFFDVSGLTSFSPDDQQQRYDAKSRLDDAILNVLEHQGKLNADRARMRIGRVLEVIGLLLVVVGFRRRRLRLVRIGRIPGDVPVLVGLPGAGPRFLRRLHVRRLHHRYRRRTRQGRPDKGL